MSYYPYSYQFVGAQLTAQHKVIFAPLDQLDLSKSEGTGKSL